MQFQQSILIQNFQQQKQVKIEVGQHEDANAQYRDYMEDGLVFNDEISKDINELEPCFLFGVFDGHGGADCMKYLKKNLVKQFINSYQQRKDNDMHKFLFELFKQLNENLKKENTINSDETGSTGTIGFLKNESFDDNEQYQALYLANVGDTRAVLFEDYMAIRLTYDDKASDEQEQNRVKQDGGDIFQGRVSGQLAITRAFGDFSLSNQGVICRPHITKTMIRKTHKYLVIASDGLWDMVDDRAALNNLMQNQNKNLTEKAKDLIENAKKLGSRDNIIVLVVQINN